VTAEPNPLNIRNRATVPAGSAPGTAHLILEVPDHTSLHLLTRCRRVLLEITTP